MDSLDRRQGLSSEQVAQRVRDGLSNADEGIKTKTEKQIILENTFTFFNILNFVLALFVLLVGSFKNLLFLGVIFSNIIIGSFQGIRAKRTIDKLSLISAPKASVLRDGKLQTIPVSGIVMNDVLHLSTGQQICADAIVLEGEAEVNESLITGESDPVLKRAGDELLSGSFIVSGSDAARTVSNLVLLDSNFASMPQVVKEGRRSINNLQRSASLFLQKTIYSTVLGVLFIFLSASYPFEPIQLTFISSITIGIPSFILALEPNNERISGSFLANVLKKSFPSALTMILGVLFLTLFKEPLNLTNPQVSTLSVIVAFAVGFMLMFKLCLPFNALRGALFGTMVAAFFVGYIGCMDLVSMVPLTAPMLFILIPLLIVSVVFMVQTNHFMEHFAEHHTRRLLQSRFFQSHRRKRREAAHKDRHAARRTRRRTEQPSRVRDSKRA